MVVDRPTSLNRWVLDEASLRIGISTEAGVIIPSGLSIWESEFEGNSEAEGIPVSRPSEDLPQIQFSRFPIEMAIVVSGTTANGLQVRLVGTDGTVSKDLPPNDPDQILIANVWYPVDRDLCCATFRALSEAGISPPCKINIGQLIWIRSTELPPITVRDMTVDTDAGSVSLPSVDVFGLMAELYPYQETGVAFLSSVANESLGCILADEMGLGKTLQVIALLLLEHVGNRSPNLVICPATLIENWRREIAVFSPSLLVLVHSGNDRTGDFRTFATYDVVIVSYETAVRDEPMLSSVQWNVLAIDEAQNIKNPDAQRTAVTKCLPRRVSIAVTGTPVENSLTDLWSIADFALPNLLGSKTDFETEYDDSHEDASRLAPIVAPILLRRRISEVATDLPPRIDIPQAVRMTKEMALEYEAIRKAIQLEYPHNASLVALGKLRQFCSIRNSWDFSTKIPQKECRSISECWKYSRRFSRREKRQSYSQASRR